MNVLHTEEENEIIVAGDEQISDQTVSASAYALLVTSIERSTMAMKELMRQHSTLKFESAEKIASLQDQLSEEKHRSDAFASEIETLERANARLVEELTRKDQDFESLVDSMNSMRASFEEATVHLEEKTEWLDHIGSRITSELNLAVSEAERMLNDPGVEG